MDIRAIEEEKRKQREAFVETQVRDGLFYLIVYSQGYNNIFLLFWIFDFHLQQKEAEYQHQKQEVAATKLQKFYRGFRYVNLHMK